MSSVLCPAINLGYFTCLLRDYCLYVVDEQLLLSTFYVENLCVQISTANAAVVGKG